MKYDLNLLPVLVALMEERNVTRAAERLGMTQPALSNALNRLRDMLHDPLFIRERYGMRPTQMAEELMPVITTALASLDDVIQGQQEFDPSKTTRLFTLAPNSYVEFVLMPALVARLRESAPGIRVRLMPFGNDLIETGVISGTTDMVLGRIVDAPNNMVVQHLIDEGLACVVRADHPEIGNHLTAEQYERIKHVNVLPPGRMRAGLYQALEQQGLKRQVAVSVTHFLAVPEMIAVTDYCATLPGLICRHLAKDPRLKVIPAPVNLGTFPVEMGWHVRYRHDPAHRWLRSLIGSLAKELLAGSESSA
ncbi:LysR substrate-binding domain-containing protein [Serratia sp. M24T3]|uniref:LysR substrate-binding domain-containing protein n=1 Tax=Rouxiella sp. WC2420 TaxID=3234145 RepID=A0AB39VXB1_9GAMM|nr:LysR substrate-binding domain-containing protein [Serratia sp. M24T3]EIC84989.1 LysR family transcriptional regulator [Serratia sp. M24T3]